MTAELLKLPAAAYHAGELPGNTPHLSKTIIHKMVTASPAHAWAAHPRLNPDWQPEEEAKFDVGTVAHALLLEGAEIVHIVYADDWRTNAAKEERDLARMAGKIPLLAKQWDGVCEMADAVRDRLKRFDVTPALFASGKPEQTLVWEDNGVSCKALVDWLHDDLAAIDDLKTTSRSASPEQWSRTMFGVGCDIQAAFYLRGLRAVFPDAPPAVFRFVVAETKSPYAVSVFQLSPAALELADAKCEWAIGKWRECMEGNEWPAYPETVCHIDPPVWEETRFFEREMRDAP